uniref:CSON004975 protein n=1 Tax=Culicoides sonorensis TaxID=179676 RepID=A0A336LUP3_CULSO
MCVTHRNKEHTIRPRIGWAIIEADQARTAFEQQLTKKMIVLNQILFQNQGSLRCNEYKIAICHINCILFGGSQSVQDGALSHFFLYKAIVKDFHKDNSKCGYI